MKKIPKSELYTCPKCGECGCINDYEIDECLSLEMFCEECGATWREYALLAYDGCRYEDTYYDYEGEEEE